jgi:hypothetical protein
VELSVVCPVCGLQPANRTHNARDFSNIETRAVIKLFFLQGKAPKEIHAILIEIYTIVWHRKKLGGPV